MGLNLTDMVEPNVVLVLMDRLENNCEMTLEAFRDLITEITLLSPENIEIKKVKQEIHLTELEILNDQGNLLVPVGIEPRSKINFGKQKRLLNLQARLDNLLVKEKIG